MFIPINSALIIRKTTLSTFVVTNDTITPWHRSRWPGSINIEQGIYLKKIHIQFDELTLQAQLNESATADEIWKQLPLESRVNTWGEEIYFEIPVNMPAEPDAREIVAVGELGYWPTGQAFCIFFGPTPVSTDERPRAYSPVNIIGEVLQDHSRLKEIKDGQRVNLIPVP
jgi:hypothetical protein